MMDISINTKTGEQVVRTTDGVGNWWDVTISTETEGKCTVSVYTMPGKKTDTQEQDDD